MDTAFPKNFDKLITKSFDLWTIPSHYLLLIEVYLVKTEKMVSNRGKGENGRKLEKIGCFGISYIFTLRFETKVGFQINAAIGNCLKSAKKQ